MIYLDNASYHCNEVLTAMAKLQIPVLFAGPYGYDGSPCEKLFAHLKLGELVPDGISTGKK